MRCKVHPHHLGAGVCASCLRDRLLTLAASQNRRVNFEPPPPPPPQPPPPLIVSPYLAHRRSLGPSEQPDQTPRRYLRRFYSTPQPRHADADGLRRSRFSLLSILFGHPRSDPDPDPEPPRNSWLSALLRGGRRRRNALPAPKEAGKARQPCRATDRGMSPARGYDSDESSRSSGCSTDSSGELRRPASSPLRRTPIVTRRHSRGSGGGGISGFAVCLSPLVRPSPRRGPEVGPFEARHAPGACPALGPNRSRKLVHIGRL